jgi:hypothetical protein
VGGILAIVRPFLLVLSELLLFRSVKVMLWAEYVPDINSLRVFHRESDGELEVLVQGHRIIARIDENTTKTLLHLPLDYPNEDIHIGEFSSSSLTIRLPVQVSPDFLHSVSQSLIEDWASIRKQSLICRHCSGSLEDVLDMETMTPCLLPSAMWGFEDMRVCEECGPLVCKSTNSSAIPKKTKSVNVYVTEADLLLDGKEEILCPSCGSGISEPVLEGERLWAKMRAGDAHDMRVRKTSLGGPLFASYTDVSIFFSKLIADDISKIAISRVDNPDDRIFITFLTGKSDVILSVNGIYCWATKVMFSRNVAKPADYTLMNSEKMKDICDELDRFSLPNSMGFSKKWTMSVIRLPPTVVEL